MGKNTLDRELPKDTFAAIGEVIVHWSHLETLIDVAIYSMMGLKPSKGAWITTGLRFNGKMGTLQSIAINFFKGKKDTLDLFNKQVGEIQHCYGERNRIDHAIWWHLGPDAFPSLRVRVTAQNISPPEVNQMGPKEIRRIGERISKAMHSFNDFLEKHTPPPPS